MAYFITSQDVRITQTPASLVARGFAFVVDYIIIALMYFLIINVTPVISKAIDLGDFGFYISFVVLFLPLTYPLIAEAFFNGQTVGKLIMKIRVVTLEGGGPKLTSLILRWITLPFDLVLAMGFGELCVFFTERQQRLGDLVAGTWVVRTQTYESNRINLTAYTPPENYVPIYPKAKDLKPHQAALIDEALMNLYLDDSIDLRLALSNLKPKVEAIVGEAKEEDTSVFLSHVVRDYRLSK